MSEIEPFASDKLINLCLSCWYGEGQRADSRDDRCGESNGRVPLEGCHDERKCVVHGCNDTSLSLGVKKMQVLCLDAGSK